MSIENPLNSYIPLVEPPDTSDPPDRYDWAAHARPSQRIPLGDWCTWLIMAGRGFGKTRTGAETIRQWVKEKTCRRIALVGDTELAVQEVMIHGHSGLLNVHPSHERPTYTARNQKVTWPCGAVAHVYTAHAYEGLRGPQFDGAWIDELAKFEHPQHVWDQLMFGLRLGQSPKVIVTTTPRPLPILETLQKDPTTVVTKGTTYENARNLAPTFVQQILKRYEGTRLGAQEILGEVLYDQVGSLWKPSYIRYGREEDAL